MEEITNEDIRLYLFILVFSTENPCKELCSFYLYSGWHVIRFLGL